MWKWHGVYFEFLLFLWVCDWYFGLTASALYVVLNIHLSLILILYGTAFFRFIQTVSLFETRSKRLKYKHTVYIYNTVSVAMMNMLPYFALSTKFKVISENVMHINQVGWLAYFFFLNNQSRQPTHVKMARGGYFELILWVWNWYFGLWINVFCIVCRSWHSFGGFVRYCFIVSFPTVIFFETRSKRLKFGQTHSIQFLL